MGDNKGEEMHLSLDRCYCFNHSLAVAMQVTEEKDDMTEWTNV